MKRWYWLMLGHAGVMGLCWLVARHVPESETWLIPSATVNAFKHYGLSLTALFLLAAGLNRLGCCWDIRSKRLDWVPSILLLASIFAALFGIGLVKIDMMRDTAGILTKVGIYGFGSLLLVMLFAYLFISGMVHEKSAAEKKAERTEAERQCCLSIIKRICRTPFNPN